MCRGAKKKSVKSFFEKKLKKKKKSRQKKKKKKKKIAPPMSTRLPRNVDADEDQRRNGPGPRHAQSTQSTDPSRLEAGRQESAVRGAFAPGVARASERRVSEVVRCVLVFLSLIVLCPARALCMRVSFVCGCDFFNSRPSCETNRHPNHRIVGSINFSLAQNADREKGQQP
jgi:hypothetical protein